MTMDLNDQATVMPLDLEAESYAADPPMLRYRPTMLFNREEFRVNTGSELTTAYRSPSWSRRSRFLREPAVDSSVVNH